MHVTSLSVEVTAETPSEWQKGTEWQRQHTVCVLQNTQKTSKMGQSCCVTDCTNRFDKKLETQFTDYQKLQEKEANGSAQFTETTGETWICSRQFHFWVKLYLNSYSV